HEQALERLLGGEHAALDREVDALQPTAVQEAGGVAAEQQAIGVELRHREPAALGDGLGAVAQWLAALDQRAHARVRLEALEIPVRVARRVGGIEAGDEADVPQAVGQTVDEAAPGPAGLE